MLSLPSLNNSVYIFPPKFVQSTPTKSLLEMKIAQNVHMAKQLQSCAQNVNVREIIMLPKRMMVNATVCTYTLL